MVGFTKKTLPNIAHVKVEQLGFLYTRRCNLQCEHCCNESSPQIKGKLKYEIVSKCIDDAARLGIPQIGFTGGEPFLYFDEILKLIRQAHKNKQRTLVVTNATWAKNKASAKSKINTLKKAGLDSMIISYGEFHNKAGGKISQVKAIFSACKSANIAVSVNVVQNLFYSADGVKISKQLIRLGPRAANVLKLTPFGAAAKNYPKNKRHYSKFPLDYFRYCDVLGQLACMDNGELLACCGPAVYELIKTDSYKHLRLGNIYDDSLEESLNKIKNNLFLTIMAIAGPSGFKILSNEYKPGIDWPDKFVNKCEFCMFAAKSEKFKQWLIAIEKDKKEILQQLYEYHKIIKRWGLTKNEIIA